MTRYNTEKSRRIQRIVVAVAMMEDPWIRDALARLPSPIEYYASLGETALDYGKWMSRNAGVQGLLKVARLIESLKKDPTSTESDATI